MTDYPEFKELEPLHEAHCKMLSYLDQFCEENKIFWCLARGSALGAARHGGPIPWDDDADIYMTSEGYARFRKLFAEKGDHEHYYLQELDCVDGMLPMPKFRMNGTTFIEGPFENLDMHHGIYVDIYLLHTCPPTAFGKSCAEVSSCYAILKRLSNHGYSKRKLVQPLMGFLRLFPKKFGLRTAYRQMYRWDDFRCPMLADWEMFKGNPRWFFDQSLIFPVQRVPYNEYHFPVPNQLDKYLTTYYGDWRNPPSIEQIHWGQHAKIWSATKDFHVVAKNVQTFRDENIE